MRGKGGVIGSEAAKVVLNSAYHYCYYEYDIMLTKSMDPETKLIEFWRICLCDERKVQMTST